MTGSPSGSFASAENVVGASVAISLGHFRFRRGSAFGDLVGGALTLPSADAPRGEEAIPERLPRLALLAAAGAAGGTWRPTEAGRLQ